MANTNKSASIYKIYLPRLMTTFIFVVTSSCYLRMRKNNHVLRSAPLPIIQSQLLGPFWKKNFRDVTIAFHKRLSEYFKAPNTHRCYSDLETDMERKTVSIVGSGNWWEKRKDIHLSVSRFLLKWHCVSSILQFLTVCIPGNKNNVKNSWGSFSWNALKRVELNN